MERSDYEKTLSRIENRNINKVIDFFKGLPYFANYGRAALGKLRFYFARIKYKRKHVIFKEGDPSEYVYIVINGDFELEKKVRHVENKELNYKKYISSNILGDNAFGYKSSKSEVDPKVAQFTKNKTLANNSEYSETYRIALLSRGQMFGDQDAFHGRPYQSTVICRSNDGELYQITRENFQKLKNHGDCWQKITSKYVTQEHLHYRLLKNQQKFKASVMKSKKPKSQKRESLPYNLISSKGPLLNRNEIEKREIFKEIVNDFPYAEKQKRFVESVYKDANIITDEDIKVFQNQRRQTSKKPIIYDSSIKDLNSSKKFQQPNKRNEMREKTLSEVKKTLDESRSLENAIKAGQNNNYSK